MVTHMFHVPGKQADEAMDTTMLWNVQPVSSIIRKDLSVRTLDKKRHDSVHDGRMTHTRSYCLTWIRIFPRETKGVLSSVRNKQPMKKSPWSFLKNCEEHTQSEKTNTWMEETQTTTQLTFEDNFWDSFKGFRQGKISGFRQMFLRVDVDFYLEMWSGGIVLFLNI